MISLYEIQQMVSQYIRSAELLPMIRERIQLTIEDICAANPPGKDWSFLKTSFSLAKDNDLSTDTRLVFKAPSNMRAMIEVVSLGAVPFAELIESPYAYNIEWTGREITITRAADAEVFPSGNLTLIGYQAHPSILVVDQQHQTPTWSTAWSASYPPASAILLPDEAKDVLYAGTMLKLKGYENEVSFSWQETQSEYEKGLKLLQDNYALQVYPLNPPSTPTVKWLVAVGTSYVGGERYQNQLLAIVNELAGDFADAAKVQLSDRPATILRISEAALPNINGVSIPAQYWASGMIYKAAVLTGTVTEQQFNAWEKAKLEWAENYYAINVQTSSFSLSTFGNLVKFIQAEWKSCRDDHQAWTIANEIVADIMSRVNTDNLIASKSYTTVENQKEYTLPTDLKTVIKVEIDDLEVPGRSFTSRGPTTPNMNEYQYLYFPSQQAFRLVGANLVLDRPPAPGATLVVWYYKSHVWTTTPSATVPVEPLLVIKAVQARVAIEENNGSKASYYQNEFEKAIVQYNNNQYRNYPADDRIINATPSVTNKILRAFD